MSEELRRELQTVEASLRHSEGSLVGQRDLLLLVAYLAFSVACAAPLGLPGVARATQIVLGALLLIAFLVLARATVGRLRSLGEFEQLIAYRAMATAGLVAVWVVLFLGVLAVAVGYDNLFLFMAVGPPEFWLCSALFARGAEHSYRQPRSTAP